MQPFTVCSTRNVGQLSEKDWQQIDWHHLRPIYGGYADLGPANGSALKRMYGVAKSILEYQLPIPPSTFIELVVNQTTGHSKQDFRLTMDGKPGAGKSTSCHYLSARYAIDAAERAGNSAKAFYSLDNCVMLQDTEGVVDLLNRTPKHAAVVIDDAGVAAGSREFMTISSRNLVKIYQTCRTKRWFTLFNVPIVNQLDVQVRQLVSARSRVYASYHDDGFNIIKLNELEMSTAGKKPMEYKHRFAPVDGKKIDFWVTYSPDILPGFSNFMEQYDKLREDAANDLIDKISCSEKDRKSGMTKRDKKYQDELTKHGDTILSMYQEGQSVKEMIRKTSLSEYKINKIISDMTNKGAE